MVSPVPRSHNLTVMSPLPESARVPSTERATLVTYAVWPLRVRMILPVLRSHSLTVLSQLPERARHPACGRAILGHREQCRETDPGSGRKFAICDLIFFSLEQANRVSSTLPA